MKKLILYGLLAGAVYIGYKQFEISQKRKWVSDWEHSPLWQEIVKRMTNEEVEFVYDFLKNYAPATKSDTMKPLPAPLKLEIEKISNKYNIFT